MQLFCFCANGVPLLQGIWYLLVVVPHGVEVKESVGTCVNHRSGAKYSTILHCVLLVFTIFETLEGPIHGSNESMT
jgi:hypothetical protein